MQTLAKYVRRFAENPKFHNEITFPLLDWSNPKPNNVKCYRLGCSSYALRRTMQYLIHTESMYLLHSLSCWHGFTRHHSTFRLLLLQQLAFRSRGLPFYASKGKRILWGAWHWCATWTTPCRKQNCPQITQKGSWALVPKTAHPWVLSAWFGWPAWYLWTAKIYMAKLKSNVSIANQYDTLAVQEAAQFFCIGNKGVFCTLLPRLTDLTGFYAGSCSDWIGHESLVGT